MEHQPETEAQHYSENDEFIPITFEQIEALNHEELAHRFYVAIEELASLSVKSVIHKIQEEYDQEFWAITKHLPDPSVQAIESENDDLKKVRRMRIDTEEIRFKK